jgi:hypothetical protein
MPMIVRAGGPPDLHDGPVMITIRRGTVLAITRERPGAVELTVRLDPDGAYDGPAAETDAPVTAAPAVAYPAISGPIQPGDVVVLNTTAVNLGLGTGGWHFVMHVERAAEPQVRGPGHLMKLRYTPEQIAVLGVEDDASPHHGVMAGADSLARTPVVWIPLHSMLGPVVAGARAAGAARIVYVMTDGAALPAAFSRLAHALQDAELLHGVVTAGQAFGGDLEAVNAFSGLLAARLALDAEVVVIGDGPGNTGTRTRWGASNVGSAMSLNAVAILDGAPVAALRISFVDPRPEHRGVSHHSLTALGRVAIAPVHVAVPAIDDDGRRRIVWDALREARLEARHQLVEVTGSPALDVLAGAGIAPESMGRTPDEDPEFFLAAGAAGVLAGRMAARDRGWRSASS